MAKKPPKAKPKPESDAPPKKALRGKLQLPRFASPSIPAIAAQPRVVPEPRSDRFALRWAHFDFYGEWCLGLSDGPTIVELMAQIKQLETMSPAEIFNSSNPTARGKNYDLSELPNQRAIARIAELNFGDETRISRLRITGAQRLYGFRRDPAFYAVFWDPKHEIYPSKLKHT